MRALKVVEAAGIPAMALVSTGFLRQAAASARALGIEGATVIEYPGVIPVDSEDELAAKARSHVAPAVLAALRAPRARDEAPRDEPEPRAIVASGTLADVLERFHAEQWTDGLPIVPPTRDRVEQLLRWTTRDPGEVLGVLPPEHREATVWSVAVNGVMAGCQPQSMPVLVAIVEAIADAEFGLEHAGSTPGWEPLVTVSGRITRELDMNSGAGVMRVGRLANASIGRFLRLYMRNVAGFRTPPGDTDKASIGTTFNVALAENEEALEVLGWEPFRVDNGFAAADDVVTVQSVLAISPPVYSGGTTGAELLEPIVHHLVSTSGPWAFTAAWFARWHPLVVMSPSVAMAFAADGWGKTEIRRALFDGATTSARLLERYPFHVSGREVPLGRLVAEGTAPPQFAESDDPDRQVRILLRPEWTGIVVAGDAGRNQSRIYVNNHEQGAPVSKRIEVRR